MRSILKTVGIIAEYNPLHNGHVHHFEQAKALAGADRCVVVMSGSFTQRGEPALLSKHARAEMALRMGADLVLELPVDYAVQPAEWFAYGAVASLAAAGVVDAFCFGSEAGSLRELQPLAGWLAEESGELKAELRSRLERGERYADAYSSAAQALWPGSADESEPEAPASGRDSLPLTQSDTAALLRQPNNTLALHYLIALRRLKAGLTPLTILRTGAGYHQPAEADSAIAGATAIRGLLLEGGSAGQYLPAYSRDIMDRETSCGRSPLGWERFSIPLRHLLLTQDAEALSRHHGMDEGLEHRLLRTAHELDEFAVAGLLDRLKSKRYTRTRLQRLLVHLLLGHTKEELSRERLAAGPSYLRVLGFSSDGRGLLKRMKRSAQLPVVLRPSLHDDPALARDIRASSVLASVFGQPRRTDLLRDYLDPPVMVEP